MPSIHLVTVTVLPLWVTSKSDSRQRVVPDARPVHELLVRQVHQVVDDQLVAAVDVDRLAVARPVGVVVPVQVRHGVGVGQRRVAGPHPDVAVPLHHRVGVHRGAGVDRVLGRHEGGAAVGVVADAVVAAHDLVVAAQLAHRQRRQPVPARVGQRDGPAGGGPVEHDRPARDRLGQQVAAHLVVPRGGVPGVEREVADGRVRGRSGVATWHISLPAARRRRRRGRIVVGRARSGGDRVLVVRRAPRGRMR